MAAAPSSGPDPAALAAELDGEKRRGKDAADRAAAAERTLKSLQAELDLAKTDAKQARAEAERAKAAAANTEATVITVPGAPSPMAVLAREVYDTINDVLSEIRNNIVVMQDESANLGGDGGEPMRIIKETIAAMVGQAEDAKGALRGLRDLAEG